MKEFYWQYFHNTGNVEAYLLYKTDDGQEEMPEEQAELTSLSPESEPYLG